MKHLLRTRPKERKFIPGPASAGILLTREESDEEYRFELVHGVLVVTPFSFNEEAGPNELLGSLLPGYQKTHPAGSTLDDTLPQQYVRTPTSRRIADRRAQPGARRWGAPCQRRSRDG